MSQISNFLWNSVSGFFSNRTKYFSLSMCRHPFPFFMPDFIVLLVYLSLSRPPILVCPEHKLMMVVVVADYLYNYWHFKPLSDGQAISPVYSITMTHIVQGVLKNSSSGAILVEMVHLLCWCIVMIIWEHSSNTKLQLDFSNITKGSGQNIYIIYDKMSYVYTWVCWYIKFIEYYREWKARG